MQKVLIIGNYGQLANRVAQRLGNDYQTNILDGVAFDDMHSYLQPLQNVSVIYTFLGPWDVDLAFEALFEAVNQVNPPLKQFIMLSTAGIDNELTNIPQIPGIDDLKEYLNQQRYAVKLVDEYEINYTVLRPVAIVEHPVGTLKLVDEGQAMPWGQVSADSVAHIAVQTLTEQRFINQSMGLIEE